MKSENMYLSVLRINKIGFHIYLICSPFHAPFHRIPLKPVKTFYCRLRSLILFTIRFQQINSVEGYCFLNYSCCFFHVHFLVHIHVLVITAIKSTIVSRIKFLQSFFSLLLQNSCVIFNFYPVRSHILPCRVFNIHSIWIVSKIISKNKQQS